MDALHHHHTDTTTIESDLHRLNTTYTHITTQLTEKETTVKQHLKTVHTFNILLRKAGE